MPDLFDLPDPRDDLSGGGGDDRVDTFALAQAIATRLDDLDPEERVVVRLRFGLDDAEPKSAGEIATLLGVHANTVKAVERRALAKLAATQG
jgi:RNA polymerase primary sigma factor